MDGLRCLGGTGGWFGRWKIEHLERASATSSREEASQIAGKAVAEHKRRKKAFREAKKRENPEDFSRQIIALFRKRYAGMPPEDAQAQVELFEQIRREYEFGVRTIAGVARKLGVHRRMVREAPPKQRHNGAPDLRADEERGAGFRRR